MAVTTQTDEVFRIAAQGLGKRMRRYHRDRPMGLKETLVQGFHRLMPVDEFWPVRGVTFSVKPGHALGVIGGNGAGKSTLLRLIGGVGKPDEGSVMVHGRINSLLELGAGFHHELTGRENVYVNGVINGLTRREVRNRLDDIVAFAELDHAIDSPLRTYSSGMQMRLAFAIAIHTDHDILLVDEVLSVGDIAFQSKCMERIVEFKRNGSALVIVSHEGDLIKDICEEALWLREGHVMAHGPAADVVDRYIAYMMPDAPVEDEPDPDPAEFPVESEPVEEVESEELDESEEEQESDNDSEPDPLPADPGKIKITGIALRDHSGRSLRRIESGQPVTVRIGYCANEPIVGANFVVTIRNDRNEVVCNVFTHGADWSGQTLIGPGSVTVQIGRLDLIGGDYHLDVGIYESGWTKSYAYRFHAKKLAVESDEEHMGVLLPPVDWHIDIGSTQPPPEKAP